MGQHVPRREHQTGTKREIILRCILHLHNPRICAPWKANGQELFWVCEDWGLRFIPQTVLNFIYHGFWNEDSELGTSDRPLAPSECGRTWWKSILDRSTYWFHAMAIMFCVSHPTFCVKAIYGSPDGCFFVDAQEGKDSFALGKFSGAITAGHVQNCFWEQISENATQNWQLIECDSWWLMASWERW